MSLNVAQLQVLKAAILAETDVEFVALRTAGSTGLMAEWYNADSTFVVWRTEVPIEEIMNNGFEWTRVDNATVGQARIWEWLTQLGVINPSKANIRAAITEAWPGTPNNSQRAAIEAHCKRNATRGEALFATGTGTTVTPGLLGFEGFVTDQDVVRALNEV